LLHFTKFFVYKFRRRRKLSSFIICLY